MRWIGPGGLLLLLLCGAVSPVDAGGDNSHAIYRTAEIDGARGGALSAGRFTLEVPAGAFDGQAEVGISVPGRDATWCELQIFPGASRGFSVPFTLKARVDDATVDVLPNLAVLTLNEHTGEWTPVPGTEVVWSAEKIEAPLSHFSIFMVGDPELGRSIW